MLKVYHESNVGSGMKLVIIDSGVNPSDDQQWYWLMEVFNFNKGSRWSLQGVAILDLLVNQDWEILSMIWPSFKQCFFLISYKVSGNLGIFVDDIHFLWTQSVHQWNCNSKTKYYKKQTNLSWIRQDQKSLFFDTFRGYLALNCKTAETHLVWIRQD